MNEEQLQEAINKTLEGITWCGDNHAEVYLELKSHLACLLKVQRGRAELSFNEAHVTEEDTDIPYYIKNTFLDRSQYRKIERGNNK